MINSVGDNGNLFFVYSPSNSGYSCSLTNSYDTIVTIETWQDKTLIKTKRKNNIQSMKRDHPTEMVITDVPKAKGRNQSIIKMYHTDIGVPVYHRQDATIEFAKKMKIAFFARINNFPDNHMGMHSLNQFIALLFHSAGSRRIFVTNEQDFHILKRW